MSVMGANWVATLRRLFMMIGGEAIQSAFHFALNILLLHRLAAGEYGVFALAMVMGGVALSYVRSLAAVPASIWIGRTRGQVRSYVYDVTFTSAAFILSALISLIATALMAIWGASDLWALCAFVFFWSFRSYLRICRFAQRQQVLVAISDMVFTLSSIVATIYAIWQATDLLRMIFVLLALTNALGVAVMVFGARRPIRFTAKASVRKRWRKFWKVIRWSAISATTTTLQGQAVAFLVATLAGPAAYAPIAAVLVLFAPLRILSAALANMVQPEISMLAGKDTPAIWAQMKTWTILLAVGGAVYGGVVLAALPYLRFATLEGVDRQLIGLSAWAIFFMAMLYVMPRITLEVFDAFKTVAVITSIAAIFSLLVILLILAVAPPEWALLGAAASEALVVVASWIAIKRRLDGADDRRAVSNPVAGHPHG